MVTWHALGFSLLAIVGVCMAAGGCFAGFAAGMATAPSEGAGNKGCVTALVGVALLGLSIWELVA